MALTLVKPRLSWLRIAEMNLGFFGLQFSFGLQQSNMGPIYSYLGASEATMPLLWLAGPITGLIVQPLIGVISDRTITRLGRRTPYFLVGAILCSLCLWAMPYSKALWVAASLLWVLDAANNVTMEPYRAYAADRLRRDQLPLGYLMQSAFTGLAQTLAYLAPSIMVWGGVRADLLDANGIPVVTRVAFVIGAVLSIGTIIWSVVRVPELPIPVDEEIVMRSAPISIKTTAVDLKNAIVQMPAPMRQLAVAMLFQWYAMFAYWQFIVLAIARGAFGVSDPGSAGFRQAALLNGQAGGFYNFVAFLSAFAMVPIVKRFGSKSVHTFSLAVSGAAMITIFLYVGRIPLLVPMIGIGIGWASMMGNPYVMLADSAPPEKTGTYMGVFNMFIVIPMIIESLTLPLIYGPLLAGDPRNVLGLAGMLMFAAAVATAFMRETRKT